MSAAAAKSARRAEAGTDFDPTPGGTRRFLIPLAIEIRNSKRVARPDVQGIERAEPKRALRPFHGRFGLTYSGESYRTAAKREDIGVAQRERAVEEIKRRGVVMLVERNDQCSYRQRGCIVAAPGSRRVGVTLAAARSSSWRWRRLKRWRRHQARSAARAHSRARVPTPSLAAE